MVLQAAQKQWHRWRWDKAPLGPKLPWNTSIEINKGSMYEVWSIMLKTGMITYWTKFDGGLMVI